MQKTNSPQSLQIDLSGRARESTESVFYRWAINVGKTIIVIVELVALGALFYRFYIDRQLVDQRDEIARKEFLVQAQSSEEMEFRSIHSRLERVEEIATLNNAAFRIMDLIREKLNESVFSSGDITIQSDTVVFKGISPSIFPVNNFIDELKQQGDVQSISLDDVTSTAQGVRFTLRIRLISPDTL